MNKKITDFCLCIFMITAVFTGCEKTEETSKDEVSTETSEESTQSQVDNEKLQKLKDELPNIILDGSTSTIPLEADSAPHCLG